MAFMSWIVKWFKRFFTRGRGKKPQVEPTPAVVEPQPEPYDPYRPVPLQQPAIRLPGNHQLPESFREAKLAYVSRHGLWQAGLNCSNCHARVAEIGEFTKIQPTSRGESIPCLECGTVLLASPDDDVDPVSPAEKYDESVYHTFSRPPQQKRYQRMTSSLPAVRDWVVIVQYKSKYGGRDLDTAEGRVLSLADRDGVSCAEIALSGNDGIAGARDMGADIEWIPVTHVFPMIQSTLRVTDPVRFTRGHHFGVVGKLTECANGRAEVLVPSGSVIRCPIEHIERFHHDELRTLPNPTTSRSTPSED